MSRTFTCAEVLFVRSSRNIESVQGMWKHIEKIIWVCVLSSGNFQSKQDPKIQLNPGRQKKLCQWSSKEESMKHPRILSWLTCLKNLEPWDQLGYWREVFIVQFLKSPKSQRTHTNTRVCHTSTHTHPYVCPTHILTHTSMRHAHMHTHTHLLPISHHQPLPPPAE